MNKISLGRPKLTNKKIEFYLEEQSFYRLCNQIMKCSCTSVNCLQMKCYKEKDTNTSI